MTNMSACEVRFDSLVFARLLSMFPLNLQNSRKVRPVLCMTHWDSNSIPIVVFKTYFCFAGKHLIDTKQHVLFLLFLHSIYSSLSCFSASLQNPM